MLYGYAKGEYSRQAKLMQTIVKIPGMHCEGCVNLIKDVSMEEPGVQNIEIDLDTKIVTLEHDDTFDMADWKDGIEILDDAYKVVKA